MRPFARFPWIRLFAAMIGCGALGCLGAAEPVHAGVEAGPLWHEFPLTLTDGQRREVLGPFWTQEASEGSTLWRLPPLISHSAEPDVERSEYEVLYPLFTYDRFGTEWRAQLMQLLSLAGGSNTEGDSKRRTTIFPFYFRQTSSNPTNNYVAVIPFYGHLRNRLFRDEVEFILAPLWMRTHKRGVVTDNYVAPFFHVRHGEELHGWQFWPVVGRETKGITWRTNSLDEPVKVGGHEHFFAAWPFYINHRDGLGTTNASTNRAVIPLFSVQRSPERDNTTWLWPFFTHTVNRNPSFEEWGAPYPFIGWARGPGKHATRVFPLYGSATNATTRQEFLLWPMYSHKRIISPPLDRQRTRYGLFAYSDIRQRNTATGQEFRRRDLWPLMTRRNDFDGSERLQVLAPLEPFFPNNKGFERLWTPLWSVYRAESSPRNHRSSQSLLWNLWRRDVSLEKDRTSMLFGLVRTQKTAEGRQWRLFWSRFREDGPPEKHPADHRPKDPPRTRTTAGRTADQPPEADRPDQRVVTPRARSSRKMPEADRPEARSVLPTQGFGRNRSRS